MFKHIGALRISFSLVVLLLTGLVFGPGNAQAVVCLPVSEPLAWWGFDGDFQDLSGYGHDGVLYGQVGFEDSGICFSAGNFGGSPNYLLTADDPVLALEGSFSIMAWVKPAAVSDHAKIYAQRSGNRFIFLGLDSGVPYGGLGDGAYLRVTPRPSGAYCDYADHNALSLNEWHLLVFIYDHPNKLMRLYVDGQQRGDGFAVKTDFALPDLSGIQISIGADSEGSSAFYQGLMDNLAVFGRVLTEEEIAAAYGIAGLPDCRWISQVTDVQQGLRNDGGAVLALRSDPQTMLGDLTGDTADGTFFSLGYGGSAVVEIDQALDRSEGSVTVYETTWGTDQPLESADVYAWNGGSWVLLGRADNQTGADTHPSQFEWTGFATRRFKVVDRTNASDWDAAGDGFDVDGIKVCGRETDAPLISITFETDRDTILEGETATLSWTVANAEQISVDQGIGVVTASGSLPVTPGATTVYTLTASSAAFGTATASVTVAYQSNAPAVRWPMDGNAQDVIGDCDGSLQNGAGFGSGLFDQALVLDGVSQHVTVDDAPVLQPGGSFTITAWVKPGGFGQYAKIISKRSGNSYWFLGLDQGVPYGGLGSAALNYQRVTPRPGGAYCDYAETTPLVPGRWSHLVFVYDQPAKVMWLYVNNQRRGPFAVRDDFQTPVLSGVKVSIGADEQGTDRFFGGSIDDPALYHRALSADDVADLYASAELPTCSWGQLVVEYAQTTTKGGDPVPIERSDIAAVHGPITGSTEDGTFFSLGMGGFIVIDVGAGYTNGSVTIFETTWGSDQPLESADVYAWDGTDWRLLGSIDNQEGVDSHPSTLAFSGFTARQFKMVDTTNPDGWDASGDGFDVDGIEVCGTPQGQTEPPTVHIDAEPSSIPEGGTTTLGWTSTNADQVVIDQGIGQVAAGGSLAVSPAVSTLYTITATGPGGTAQDTVLVEVIPRPVINLAAGPQEIERGRYSTLSWTSTGADTMSIDQGIGSVDLSGTTIVTPEATTIYTATATGPGGVSTASATVMVIEPKPWVTFSVNPSTINQGDSATLTWSIENGETARIDQGIGDIDLTGSRSVSPGQNTIYTLTAQGPGGTTVIHLLLKVQPAPTVSLSVSPDTMVQGQAATLSWTSAHAVSAEITPDIGSVDVSGSAAASPDATTTYTILVTGPTGLTASAQAVLTVLPLAQVTFSAEPAVISVGESALLSWDSSNVTSLTIEPGIGFVDPAGSRSVSPNQTTIYTIQGTGSGQTVTQTVTVTVRPRPTADLSAAPDRIRLGGSSVLTWTTSNAHTVSLDQGVGPVEPSGSLTVNPGENTTYTLTATGDGGTVTAEAPVTVLVPPTADLTADPAVITAGDTASLVWTTTNADTVTIEPDLGLVDASGSVDVTPAVTTTYHLTATGEGGSQTAQAAITVHPRPQAHIEADRDTLFQGESATLTWTSENSDTVVIDQGIGSVDPNGSMSVTPTEDTTYTLTVSGLGGTVTDSVTLYLTDADLEPTGIDLTGVTVDGRTLVTGGTAVVEVTNYGLTTPVHGYQIVLFEDLNLDEAYSPDLDRVLGSASVVSGPAGGESLSVPITVSGLKTFKDNRLFAMVDPDDAVRESNESNNLTHSMAACHFQPPVGQFNPVVEWAWTSTETNPTSVRVMCAPAVANLNDDNGDGLVNTKDIPDIVFNTYKGVNDYFTNGTLRALNGDGSGELFSVALDLTMPDSSPAIGDIDNDGLPEVLTMGEDKRVIAFENDGTLKWISTDAVAISHTFLSINLADLDQDGTPEILVGGHVFNHDGSTRWIGSAGLGDGTALVANLDLAGDPEVVIGPAAYRSDGQVYWSGTTTYWRWAAIGNFDEDAFPEVVEVGMGYVSLLEHDGTVKWGPVALSGLSSRGGPPTVADFDGDGLPEIGVAGRSRYYVLEHDGTVKWQYATVDSSSGITASSVFDFDGDGEAEVVYGDEQKFRIFKGLDGTVLFETPNLSLTHLELPVVADVDNDNNAEIVVVSNLSSSSFAYGIRVYGDAADTWLNTRKIWNQHTYHITNVNDDATIPAIEANNWATYNNYRQNAMDNPLGCMDLDASYIRVDQSDYPESVNILARAGNGGVWHVAAGTKVSYYLGHPDTGTLLGTVEVGRLEAGAYEDASFTWNNPPSGLQEIYVRVDDDGTGQGQVLESNEDNNLAGASLVIGNAKPMAQAGDDQTVYWGQTVQLDGSGSNDGDSDPLTHIWTITSKPAGSNAQLSDFTAVSPTFEADRPGVYTITLVVHDGTEESEPDTVTITAEAIAMPDVVGVTQAEAENQITAALLQVVDITRQSSLSIPESQVMTQTPAAGTQLPINAATTLVVSSGLPRTIVPSVAWLTQADAESAISAAGLIPGTVTDVYSTTVPEGQVATQSPAAGLSVPIYTNVDLGLSKGPEPITVPDVVGLQRTTAESNIVTAKLAVGTITEIYSDTIPEHQVSTQDPAAGQTVPAGTQINLTVSLGAEPVTVPDVVGLTQSVAESTLFNADLALGAITENYDNTIPEHQVMAQDPAAGTSVTPQTPVNLTVSLGPDVVPPQVSITVTPEHVPLGESVTITVTADDNLGVATQTLTVNDVEVTLSGHQAQYTPSAVGDYTASFTATDEAGNSDTATADFKAFDPNDVTPPVVHIDAPEDGGQITCPTDIIGMVQDQNLDYWVLQYTPVDSSDWITIASGDTNMDADELGRFDPTTLPNGIYEVRLYAVDLSGKSDSDSITLPVTGFLKPGINKLSFTDLQVPVSGINITVVRSYDSFDKRDKDFGYCWSVAVHDVNLDENRIPGENWYEEETGSFIPNWEIRPEKSHFVVVTYPDGNTDIFELEAEYLDPITKGGWEVILKFNPKYGTTSSLEFLDESIFFYNNGAILDEDGGVLDPKRYLLTTKEGQKLRINQSTGLEKMEDRNSNSITISESGIIHSSGKSITFTRDENGRITKITDPMGYELMYTYNSNGDLVTFTDQEGYVVSFTYDEMHNLLGYTDPRGIQSLTCEYDESGRLIATYDAKGNKSEIQQDLQTYTSVVTNRRGYQTTYIYDENDYVLNKTDHYGNVTSYTYDDNGNKTRETNALGHTTTYTYDENDNLLNQTDPLGNTIKREYNRWGKITDIRPSCGKYL